MRLPSVAETLDDIRTFVKDALKLAQANEATQALETLDDAIRLFDRLVDEPLSPRQAKLAEEYANAITRLQLAL